MEKDIFENLKKIDEQVREIIKKREEELTRLLKYRKYRVGLYSCDATVNGNKYVRIIITKVTIEKDLSAGYAICYRCQMIDVNNFPSMISSFTEETLDTFNLIEQHLV